MLNKIDPTLCKTCFNEWQFFLELLVLKNKFSLQGERDSIEIKSTFSKLSFQRELHVLKSL